MKFDSDDNNQTNLEVMIDKELLGRAVAACKLDSIDLTTLVTRCLNREIADIESRNRTILLSPEDYERFMSMVESIRPMSPALERAAKDRAENGFNFDSRDSGK